MDYLNSSVVPLAAELISAPPNVLPKNLFLSLGGGRGGDDICDEEVEITTKATSEYSEESSYRTVHHYLNTHFQLNREDCLAQIRRGIYSLRERLVADGENASSIVNRSNIDNACIPVPTQNKLSSVIGAIARNRSGNSGIYLYENVCVESVERMRDDVGYCISFDVSNSRNIDWSSTQRFMNGSLLCLSPDGTFNEASLVVATVLKGVIQPTGSLKGWFPTVTIGIDKASVTRFNPMDIFVMAESMVFFDAYRPVLAALQKIGKNSELPFEKNLLGKSKLVLVRFLI